MIGTPIFVTLYHVALKFSPTKDGAGLTQGLVSRKLPTGLAGLAGLTMRGAWGGGKKEGSDGAGPPVLSPTRQTDQTDLAWFPGIAAPPNHHTHPCPQGLSKRGHARLGGDGLPTWGVSRGLGPLGYRCGKGAQGGVGTLAPVPHLGRKKGRPPPHQLLPYDRARSAPLAWLAPS